MVRERVAEAEIFRDKIYLDRRSFPFHFFLNYKGGLALTMALLFFGIIIQLPSPVGLSLAGQRCLAIFSFCLISWLTNILPLAVTSLMALGLLPLLGVMESKEVFALFGNEAVFFILGTFILAVALMKTGLNSRLALWLLNRFLTTPARLLLGILFSAAFLSCWMPEHAVAAFLFPVVLEIAQALELKPSKSSYGKALFLALAWGSIIGGVQTFLGGARNILAVGMLREFSGQQIGFLEWIIAVWPIVLWNLIIAYLILIRYFPPDIPDIRAAIRILQEKQMVKGKITREEKKTLAILILTIIAWVGLGHTVGLASITIISVTTLFFLDIVSWHEVEEYVNWGIILMYGGAMVLGIALVKTGAAHWAVTSVVSSGHFSPAGIIAILVIISISLTELMSNSAVVAMILPLGLTLSSYYQIDPKVIVYAVAVPAGLAVTLPMSTPPMAICYSSGYLQIRDVLVYGLFLILNSIIFFLLTTHTYWKLIGIEF
jgi:sodium-dependent dicarboxylate transporter 2/3/5